MRKLAKQQKILLFVVGCIVFVSLFSITSDAFALNWPDSPATKLKLTPTCPPPAKAPGCIPTDLTNAIKYFYEWAIVLGGLAAFIMLLVAGFQYLTSTGDPGKTKEAKNRITSAIGGLVLLLSSVLILNVVNPELTALRVPTLSVPTGSLQIDSVCTNNDPKRCFKQDCKKVIFFSETEYQGQIIAALTPGDRTKLLTSQPKSMKTEGSPVDGKETPPGTCVVRLYARTVCVGKIVVTTGGSEDLSATLENETVQCARLVR